MKPSISNILIGLIIFVAAGFLAVYLYGWHQNAVAGTKYDLVGLEEVAKWALGQLTVLFSSHSLLNTPIPWTQKGDIK